VKHLCLSILMLLASLPGFSQARATETELQALKDKVFTLRNFSRNSTLRFDEKGLPKKIEESAPWTLYAQFQLRRVDLKEDRLVLRGPRIVSHYDSKAMKMVQFRSNLELEVIIDVNPGATMQDIVAVTNRVFIRSEELAGRVPTYWREFLGGKQPDPPPSKDANAQKVLVQQLAGNVMQAKLVKMVKPKYPEDAKQYSFEGYVVFRAEISERGEVENLMILTPAGAGFDENAAEAVYQWKYTPQTLDGNPVQVITTITVNYSFDR
jgi:TonB family protein